MFQTAPSHPFWPGAFSSAWWRSPSVLSLLWSRRRPSHRFTWSRRSHRLQSRGASRFHSVVATAYGLFVASGDYARRSTPSGRRRPSLPTKHASPPWTSRPTVGSSTARGCVKERRAWRGHRTAAGGPIDEHRSRLDHSRPGLGAPCTALAILASNKTVSPQFPQIIGITT